MVRETKTTFDRKHLNTNRGVYPHLGALPRPLLIRGHDFFADKGSGEMKAVADGLRSLQDVPGV